MLLFVQLAWVVLVQGFDCFLVSVHMFIGPVGQECMCERSWNGGVLLVVGLISGRC